jgi:DNA-binding LacI/PurR family transcriptional regulator
LVRHSFVEHTEGEVTKVDFTGTLRHQDTEFEVSGTGNGPIDAFFNAIHGKKMDRFTFVDYKSHAVSRGSDSMAVAAMRALHDRGKRVPEDCSVVAIDGIDMSAYVVPALTTLVQPQRELGENAVRLLVDILKGSAGNRHLLLETGLRTGGSVSPAK